ncbi:MAG TPA: GLPGLI family protein [Segetibacter sp.]|jgi:GLPGLI family protein
MYFRINKLIVATIVLFFLIGKTSAQYNYTIIYHKDNLGLNPELIIKYPAIKSMLVFNDTLSFYNHITDNIGLNKSKTFGKRLVHHSLMYNSNKKILYNVVAYNGRFLIADDRVTTWTLLKEVKYVLGYKCFAAIRTNTNNDTIKAWYTPELNRSFGPTTYTHLPGVILEVQDQQYNWHIIAVKAQKTNHTLIFPKARIISRDEFFKKRSKIK